MVQVIGYATPVLPNHASPIVVDMCMGQVLAPDGLRPCLALAVITLVLLVPVEYAWFMLLGQL